MMADKDDAPPSVPRRIVELAAVGSLYLYFAGWIYLSELFGRLGLSNYVLDVPLYSVFVYSYRVFFGSICRLLVFLCFGVGWYLATSFARPPRWIILVFVVLFLAPFPIIRTFALRSATEAHAKIRSGAAYPVKVHALPGATPRVDALVTELGAKKLYLIAETKERFYVFYQPPAEQGQLPRGRAYVLPADSFVLEITLQNITEAR